MRRNANARYRSLSWRVLWLTVAIVMLTEVLVFLPGLARERRNWLWDHVNQAHIAALSIAAAPDGVVDASVRHELLRLVGARAITLFEPGREPLTLAPDTPLQPALTIDLDKEDSWSGIRRSLRRLLTPGDRVMLVRGVSPTRSGSVIELTLDEPPLRKTLLRYAHGFLKLSLLIATVSGLFVYLVALLLLVRPVRRLTDSIVAFRADPERTTPLDPTRVTVLRGDELAVAGHELAVMQHELRAALWRNARLTALGTALAKVSHDLRNILSPVLLSAERLEMHPDPAVKRLGAAITRGVDQATELVGQTLAFAREGPPALSRAPVELAPLIDEAAEATGGSCAAENRIPDQVLVNAERGQLLRVVSNLVRNAAEAGARRVTTRLADTQPSGLVVLELADDGPGLPRAVREKLFRPFVESSTHGGTGLGLAIAADLMRALGGDIALVATNQNGTVFRLTLPAVPGRPREKPAPRPEAGAASAEPVGSPGAP